jgi:hypothetical protein
MSIRPSPGAAAGVAVLLAVLLAPGVSAQQPAPDTSLIAASPPADEATEVFVLGTAHLNGVADRFEPAMVDSLVAALDAFGPDAIAVERISGRQTAAMAHWGGRWKPVVQRFAGPFLYHGQQVRERAGWSWSEANQRADSLLTAAQSDTASFDSETRLSLVRSLTAAYRLPSAALQWRYLPPEVRASQTVLPDTTAEALDERLTAANEVYSIGARLARERGHQRLYPIDHQAEKDRALSVYPRLTEAIGDSMQTLIETSPVVRRSDSLMQVGLERGSLLPMYRYDNSETKARADVDLQWRTLLETDLPDDVGRQWLALWETRNLHMVGHIRRVASQHPGGRVLVIVGSSHKPFFDAYLQQMMDVQVVDAGTVLPGAGR